VLSVPIIIVAAERLLLPKLLLLDLLLEGLVKLLILLWVRIPSTTTLCGTSYRLTWPAGCQTAHSKIGRSWTCQSWWTALETWLR